jgi:hypothetical protein
MALTVTKRVQVPVSTLLVRIPTECLADDDDAAPSIPGIAGKWWEARIDLATGTIAGWNADSPIDVFGKVRDEGIYRLLDASGAVVVERDNCYVPRCINDGGDYLSMTVSPDGKIAKWHPDLDGFDEPEGDDR